MSLGFIVEVYRWHLRSHPMQELLAGAGIAIGVALAFAVMVAGSSITSSAAEIVRGVTGTASVQLQARDAAGFDAAILPVVRRVPGVVRAAPLLEQRAVLVGAGGRRVAVNVASVDPALAAMSGHLTRSFVAGGLTLTSGLILPTSVATALGLSNPAAAADPKPLPRVGVELRGRRSRVTVAAVFGSDSLGPLTAARVALMPLAEMQRLARLPGRVSRILVETEPGESVAVTAALERLVGGRVAVSDATSELGLLRQALGPSGQATAFFATISALLGFLLAFNAMLLTAPKRRADIANLFVQGARPRDLVGLVLFQSAVLGLAGSAVGLALGVVLANGALSESAEYLSPAFTLGTRTVITAGPVILSLVGGVVACMLASLPMLSDLVSRRPRDEIHHGEAGNVLGRRARLASFAAAVVLLAASAVLLFAAPSRALLACGLVAVATVLAVPMLFAGVVWLATLVDSRAERFVMLSAALIGLRGTTLRAMALASTGAVAVFGSVAIGGARADLTRGIGQYTTDYVSTADLWVVHDDDNQATNAFAEAGQVARLSEVEGVADVRRYQGAFLDVDGRRVWIIARPSADRSMVPSSQLVDGDAQTADARLRSGGWATVSAQIAQEQGVSIGDLIELPTPTGPRSLRVAATTTNLGWPPGAIITDSRDFARAWGTDDPTALEIDLAPGASPANTARRVEAALGSASGLHVLTAEERSAQINASAREGLSRLGQISVLLLLAACLAMATATGASIWQRRPRLSAYSIHGFTPQQIWRTLLIESLLVLGAGCLAGAIAGVFGQVVVDRYLEQVTGFPTDLAIAGWSMLTTTVLVTVGAILVVAIPGWFAARVPPSVALQED